MPTHSCGAGRTRNRVIPEPDGRFAEDDKDVQLDHEPPVALGNATEGAARATVLKVTQKGAESWVRGMARTG